VVDDNPAIHVAVREHLKQSGERWQVSAYHTGAEALSGLAAAPPQVVLMEQTLPDGSGLDWAGRLKGLHPELPVVIHTAKGSPEKLFQALSMQAMGYVVTAVGQADWSTHLRKALAGRFALCEEAERLLPQVLARFGSGNPWGLSRREQEVMHCLCGDLSDKEIASALDISDETVHVHLHNAFKKLKAHGRGDAVQKFMQKWSGGGKMAGRDFDETNPFLTLLECCALNASRVECDRKHDGRKGQPQQWFEERSAGISPRVAV